MCFDGISWYAVAQFERDCTSKKIGTSFNDTLEGIWQYYDAIDSTARK